MTIKLREPTLKPRKVREKGTLVGAVILLFVVAFSTLTVLYNLPEGKARDQLSFVDTVFDPVFEQRWTLFAPEPPQTDVGLLAGYESGEESINYVNLTSADLVEQRGRLIPQKSARELDSMVTEYTGQVDNILHLAELEDVPPYFFAVSDKDFERAFDAVSQEHPKATSDYETVRGRLAIAVLDRLGGKNLKNQCQNSSGRVLIRLVGVDVPGINDSAIEPMIQTIRPIRCGEDFDARI